MTLLPVSFLLLFSLRKVVLFHLFFIFYTIPFTYNSLSLRAKKIRSDRLQLHWIWWNETSSLHWLGLYMQLFVFTFYSKNITYPSYTFDMTRFVSRLVLYVQILIGIASLICIPFYRCALLFLYSRFIKHKKKLFTLNMCLARLLMPN